MLPVARGKSEASVLRGSVPRSGIPSVALQVVPPILGEAELTAQVFVEWCNQRGITRYYIQPWERRWCTDPAPSVSHDRPPGHRGDSRCMISI